MTLLECYKLLGVTTKDTPEDAKREHKRLVRTWHPDQVATEPERFDKYQAKLLEINEGFKRVIADMEKHPNGFMRGLTDKVQSDKIAGGYNAALVRHGFTKKKGPF
jgi:DnaJ-class molecular chaperone